MESEKPYESRNKSINQFIMEEKFGRISVFMNDLELEKMTDDQQFLLLVGGNSSGYVGQGNNCKCNGNDCSCNTLVGVCG